jgi:hypothetical protein
MVALIPLLALAAPGALGQDGKADLRWKWEKGREILYRNVQTQSMELGGAAIEQEMAVTYSMTAEAVDGEGAATLKVKYEAVAAKGSGFVEYEYDSEKDKEAPANPQVATIAKLVGQSFQVKMTPKGKVTEVSGFDKIMEILVKDLQDGPQGEMVKAMMKQSFSDEAMKSNFQQMAPVLPAQAVGKGDTWKDEFTFKMPMLGAMKFGITSTLAELGEGTAKIGQDYAIDIKVEEAPDPNNPLAGQVQIKDSKAKSVLTFSTADGCFVSQKMEMTMLVAASGQEMPIKTRTEMKRVERKAKRSEF